MPEFQTVISEISEDVIDMDWACLHFKQGLTASIRQYVTINDRPTNSFNDLTALGQTVFDINC